MKHLRKSEVVGMVLDKTNRIIQEALKEAIDTKAGMQYLREKVTAVATQLKDHETRISTLESTRDLHFEKVKSAFWEAQSQLRLPQETKSE
jgi:hypothetical protein